jgi:predicted transposase YbfD/YdcC
VPADPSSPIPSGLAPLCQAGPLRPAEPPHLLAYLAAIPDPRARAGRRHPLVAILALAAAAVLAGAQSMTAIAEWATDTSQPIRAALGARRDAPDHWAVPTEATIRRTLGRLDAQAMAAVVGAWLCDRDRHNRQPQRRRQAVCVDGKTLRGARRPPAADGEGRPVHLLAAMDHATRAVLAQQQVGGAPEEVPAFQPLLANLDLAGTVVTADALQTHPAAAEFLVTHKQAHDLFAVKANQPTLLDRCAGLPWHRVPVLDRTCDRGHGRVEVRTLKAVTVNHFGFPHAAQVIQVTRKTRDLRAVATSRRWRTVTVYAVTSLTHAQARPARLADLIRGHWTIEALHHIRDVTFAEDGSQVRTGAGPSAMVCLRNLAIGVLCRAGRVNLAAALRHHARDPARPLSTLGISYR